MSEPSHELIDRIAQSKQARMVHGGPPLRALPNALSCGPSIHSSQPAQRYGFRGVSTNLALIAGIIGPPALRSRWDGRHL